MEMTNPFDLTGKVAWVNGASRGIGEAIAKLLAAQGATVLCTSRRLESCETVAHDIREAGGSADARACHAGSEADIDATLAHIHEVHGRLDILVNNAGTNPYYGVIGETPMDAYDKTMEVNLRGPFYASSGAVKLMKNQAAGGSIVNVASINGIKPGSLQGVYSMTKAAMISMTKSFAMEHGEQGIRANALCPGFTDTKMTAVFKADEGLLAQALEKDYAIKRMATPDEQAAAVLYFVSDAAGYTTGTTIVVDGGYLA